jgi:hypothetical protein
MKNVIIIAALLCLGTVTTGCEEDNTTATKPGQTQQAEPKRGKLLNTTSGDPKGECEAQTGTWSNGKCQL